MAEGSAAADPIPESVAGKRWPVMDHTMSGDRGKSPILITSLGDRRVLIEDCFVGRVED
jgi:hypothetical protein